MGNKKIKSAFVLLMLFVLASFLVTHERALGVEACQLNNPAWSPSGTINLGTKVTAQAGGNSVCEGKEVRFFIETTAGSRLVDQVLKFNSGSVKYDWTPTNPGVYKFTAKELGIGAEGVPVTSSALTVVKSECSISNVALSPDPAVIGGNVSIKIQATNCNGSSVSLAVWGQPSGATSDKLIKNLSDKPAISNGIANASWSPDQAGNFIVKASIGQAQGQSNRIEVKSATGCVLDTLNTKWSKTEANVNDSVNLVAVGTNCNGKEAIFDVNKIEPSVAYVQRGLKATFSGNKATVSWKPTENNLYGFRVVADKNDIKSANQLRVGYAGGGRFSCNRATGECVVDANGPYNVPTCNNQCGTHLECKNETCTKVAGKGFDECIPPEGSKCSASFKANTFKFKIDNPLKGKADNVMDLLAILANFIFQLGVPVAVIIIIYSGILYLVSAGRPAVYQKGTNGLKYAAIGLAVLLIGKGFVSLIQSLLSIK